MHAGEDILPYVNRWAKTTIELHVRALIIVCGFPPSVSLVDFYALTLSQTFEGDEATSSSLNHVRHVKEA